jgi:hypothetical protein
MPEVTECAIAFGFAHPAARVVQSGSEKVFCGGLKELGTALSIRMVQRLHRAARHRRYLTAFWKTFWHLAWRGMVCGHECVPIAV